MRTHDDEVDRPLARQVHNGLIGDALDDNTIAGEPCLTHPLLCHMHLMLRISLYPLQIGFQRRRSSQLPHCPRGEMEDVEQGEPCLELLR
jgi:hypothetical protein